MAFLQTLKSVLVEYYNKLSDSQKTWLASHIQTFLATFFTTIGASLTTGLQWKFAFFSALLVTAVRAGFKSAFQASSFSLLGGKSK